MSCFNRHVLPILLFAFLGACMTFDGASYAFVDPYSQELPDSFPQRPPTQAIQLTAVRFRSHVHVQEDNIVSIEVEFISPGGLNDGYEYEILPSQAVFTSPTGEPLQAFLLPDVNLKSGTEEKGLLVSELFVPKWNSPDGMYLLQYVMMVDREGGTSYFDHSTFPPGFSTSFSVTGTQIDNEPPRLIGIVLPTDVPMAGTRAGFVTTYVCVHETLSGLAPIVQNSSHVVNPSFLQLESMSSPAPQVLTHHFDNEAIIDPRYPSCAFLNISLPYYAWAGMWRVRSLNLADGAGNSALWTPRDFDHNKLRVTFYVANINQTYTGLTPVDYVPQRPEKDEDDYYYYDDYNY